MDGQTGPTVLWANGDADVIAPDFPFHLEWKYVEKLNLYAAMTQAIDDAKKAGKPPCVIHKKNHSEELLHAGYQTCSNY